MEDNIIPFWNRKTLPSPSLSSFKVLHEIPDRTSAGLAEILENMLSILSSQDLLHYDAALIGRLLYRTKKTLRNHKGFKCYQKVHRCLKSYLSMDLASVIKNVRQTAYNNLGPCKEALEWCLINLMRFAALFHRLQNTCIETAYHMHNHLTTGTNWHLAILFLACLSRIWTISRYLVISTCEWYLKLKVFLPFLTANDRWLPENYELPSDLKSWLGDVDYLQPLNTNNCTNDMKEQVESKSIMDLAFNEDLGETISRTSDSNSKQFDSKITFQNENDILEFLKKEQNYRQSHSDKSMTLNLNDADWKTLKNFLRKSIVELKSVRNKQIFAESLRRAQQKLNLWIKK